MTYAALREFERLLEVAIADGFEFLSVFLAIFLEERLGLFEKMRTQIFQLMDTCVRSRVLCDRNEPVVADPVFPFFLLLGLGRATHAL